MGLTTLFIRQMSNKVIVTSLSHLDTFHPLCQNGGNNEYSSHKSVEKVMLRKALGDVLGPQEKNAGMGS